MDTSSDGSVEITIPRSLLDVKFDTLDDEFFILVDGFEKDHPEINSTYEYRPLVILFFGVYSFIDIIGIDALDSFSPEPKILSWIKNNASWWADDQIDDIALIQGIQYLMINGILQV